MGMYTEINIACELKKDVPAQVIDVLSYMCDGTRAKPKLPSHPLFSCERWHYLFTCDSYYFRGKTHSEFEFDDIGNAWYLTVRANLKNYGGEIGLFMDWIAPYVEACEGDFIGYSRYEEDEWPTLWHYEDGKLHPTKTTPTKETK